MPEGASDNGESPEFRVSRSADGAGLVLDDAGRQFFESSEGAPVDGTAQSPATGGPRLDSPFGRFTLLGWLDEHIGRESGFWILERTDGGRFRILIRDSEAVIEPVDSTDRAALSKVVHDYRNLLNIVGTNIELLGILTEKASQSALSDPVARIMRQMPRMSASFEELVTRARTYAGGESGSLLDGIRNHIRQTAWSGRLSVEGDVDLEVDAAFSEFISRCVIEWASHAFESQEQSRIRISQSHDQAALELSGDGITEWLRTSLDDATARTDWLDRLVRLGVSGGAWSGADGGGAVLVGVGSHS
jgi:hypothetical protein